MLDKIELPKDAILDGTNYTDWKFTITAVLEQHDLDTLVFSDNPFVETAPEQVRAAKTCLIFSLNREHRNKVTHCTTAQEIWKCITNIYENTTKRATTFLCKKLMNYKIENYQEVPKGISEIQSIIATLKARRVELHETLITGAIENALPACFGNWLEVWSMRESEPTLNELLSSISLQIEAIKINESQAMLASTNYQPASRSAEKFCKYCTKTGHLVEDCFKLKAKKEKEKSASNPNQEKEEMTAFAFMAVSNEPNKHFFKKTEWIADSGCSLHMTPDKNIISEYVSLNKPINIKLGDNHYIEAVGLGVVHTKQGPISKVHFVPSSGTNLFSISSAARNQVEARYNRQGVSFHVNGKIIHRGYTRGGIYILDFDVILPNSPDALCNSATLEEWHQILGHTNIQTIKQMATNKGAIGLDISNKTMKSCCECALNNPTKTSKKADKPGQIIHLDTIGPISPLCTVCVQTEYLLFSIARVHHKRLLALVYSGNTTFR